MSMEVRWQAWSYKITDTKYQWGWLRAMITIHSGICHMKAWWVSCHRLSHHFALTSLSCLHGLIEVISGVWLHVWQTRESVWLESTTFHKYSSPHPPLQLGLELWKEVSVTPSGFKRENILYLKRPFMKEVHINHLWLVAVESPSTKHNYSCFHESFTSIWIKLVAFRDIQWLNYSKTQWKSL